MWRLLSYELHVNSLYNLASAGSSLTFDSPLAFTCTLTPVTSGYFIIIGELYQLKTCRFTSNTKSPANILSRNSCNRLRSL